jgi:hypothetical protein
MKRYPVNVFAAQLAKALGGDHVPANQDGEYFENFAIVKVGTALPYNLNISKRGYGAKADQITVTVQPFTRDRYADDYGSRIAWPAATVNGARPFKDIEKDIRRRVIDKAQPALQEYEKLVADGGFKRATLDESMARLLALPGVTENRNWPRSTTEGRVFGPNGFDARVSASGSIWVDRLTLTTAQAVKLYAILQEG